MKNSLLLGGALLAASLLLTPRAHAQTPPTTPVTPSVVPPQPPPTLITTEPINTPADRPRSKRVKMMDADKRDKPSTKVADRSATGERKMNKASKKAGKKLDRM